MTRAGGMLLILAEEQAMQQFKQGTLSSAIVGTLHATKIYPDVKYNCDGEAGRVLRRYY